MKPVDGPRLIYIGLKRIRDMGRDKYILLLPYLIRLPINMILTFSVDTIYQHCIICTRFFLHIMIFHLREKTDFTYIEILYQRIFTIFS